MIDMRSAVRRIPLATEAYEITTTRTRMLTTRRRVAEVLADRREIKLDLGGGYQPGRNGWMNVDVSREADLFWDLRYGIPFPDARVDHIYSSHLFEHLTFQQGQALLSECLRVMKPGASFSIVVPNARLYVDMYMGVRDVPPNAFGWEPAFNRTTPIDALNYVAYMAGEHKYLFDLENLLHILAASGLHGVTDRRFDPELDMAERDFESIYAVGFKPIDD